MGLFDVFKKQDCEICGKEVGMFGYKKLEDGEICKECVKKLSPWFEERRHSTVAQIKEQLAYREKNRQELNTFCPTKTYGERYELKAEFPVLCNHAMQRFSFAVCNRDVQFVTDLEDCLDKDFVPIGDVEREGSVFILPDGQVIRLKMKLLTYENGETYTQFTATDITQLYQSRAELSRENEQLRKVQSNLMQMSANMVAVTREEEILSAKMRIHDDMGRCLMAAQQYLKKCDPVDISDHMIASWHRAVSMLKNYNESEEEDMLAQIRKTCEFFKLKLVRTGELPAQEKVAYLLTCALRECLTNAVRYASATELYADFTETAIEATVTITNNGAVPDRKIVEGGGLSTLRCRVERAGGQMIVQSHPCFRLQVTLPKTKEDAL